MSTELICKVVGFENPITINLEEVDYHEDTLLGTIAELLDIDQDDVEIEEFEYEGFGPIDHDDLDTLRTDDMLEVARLYDLHDEKYALYVNEIGAQFASEDNFDNAYQGYYYTETAFAEEYVKDTGIFDGASEELVRYFDFDAYTNDLLHNYWTAEAEGGGVYIYLA